MRTVSNACIGLDHRAVIVLPCDSVGSGGLSKLSGVGRVRADSFYSRRPAAEGIAVLCGRRLGGRFTAIYGSRAVGHGTGGKHRSVFIHPCDRTIRSDDLLRKIEILIVAVGEPVAIAVTVRTEIDVIGTRSRNRTVITARIPIGTALCLELSAFGKLYTGELVFQRAGIGFGKCEFVVSSFRPFVHIADKVVVRRGSHTIIIAAAGDCPDCAVRKTGFNVLCLFIPGAVSENDTAYIRRDIIGIYLCP